MQVSRHMFIHGQSWSTLRCQSPPLPHHLRHSVLLFAIAYGRMADLKTPWGFSCLLPLSVLGLLISAFTWLLGPELIPNSHFKCFSY